MKVLGTLKNAGLIQDTHFSVIEVTPGQVPSVPRKPTPHIYFFKAGVSNVNAGFSVRGNTEMGGAAEGMEVGQQTSDASAYPVVRIEDVVPLDSKVFILKMDVQGHEPFALEGARKLLNSKGAVHMLSLEWWPSGMQKQGVADGGLEALTKLYDAGATCYDLGTHPRYINADRPSSLAAWTQFLLDVPKSGPNGDIIGGWEDLVCTFSI